MIFPVRKNGLTGLFYQRSAKMKNALDFMSSAFFILISLF